ncbi:hypothetical protein Tco_0043872, partial [Tanacetum coccineum]
YQFMKVIMSPVFTSNEFSVGVSEVKTNTEAQLFFTPNTLEDGMIQAGSGVAGLSSSGSGFHQSLRESAFGRYEYIKNHKKIVKNGQARTRESEEYKNKSKNQSRSQKS